MNVVLWAHGGSADARRAAAEGAHVLAWTDAGHAQLQSLGVAHDRLALPAPVRDAIDEAAIRWTKSFGLDPLHEGRSFRELYRHPDGWSWWYFLELFLHHSTEAAAHVRRIETFAHVLATTGAKEVEAHGLSDVDRVLLARTCIANGVLFHGRVPSVSNAPALAAVRSRALAEVVKCTGTALRQRFGGPPPAPAAGGVFFLSHAAFWREQQGGLAEHYFGPLIPGIAARGRTPVVVAVGPRAPFRRRGFKERWADRVGGGDGPYVPMNRFTDRAVLQATHATWREAARIFAALRGTAGLQALFTHEGVRFDDLAEPDLAAALLLQMPWAVRSYLEMRNALRWAKPSAVCLYAESSGWGRAAILAAQAEGVRTLGIQHGILYPKYYSYLHEPAEEDCPRPDVTAVFGTAAREFLVERGGYAPETLVVTGSPRFDELLAQARGRDRVSLRRTLGAADGERLVIVASRFKPIRETHEALGAELARLVAAGEALPDVRVLVKPHPAESDAPYRAALQGAQRVALAPPSRTLPEMLAAADLLITVESLSAVEALVLDLPLVLLSQPSNLAELVEAGVALGVEAGADPAPALRSALDDEATRAALAAARRRYLDDVAAGVDGRAGERLLDLVETVADGRPMVVSSP